ncbi:KPN_02809 family neutral zinc metallopeptidase [Nocardioides mangrovi]|uniref:Neutral zinc metallopeptidase n=1 Tax=Nocardioides mangrovi TaxID=2874580 RepID=A0ABS7UH62_9ACTN|nr:neutral zinc metallopeptidase [Nocardioides mangrovi]MBZ5739963.1 neutral zinc metallopeptidase [Nocardioides mangrovi]
MRFNPKARLDTRRMRDVRGARATGGGGTRTGGAGIPIPGGLAGGGIGGIVVVIIIVAVSMWLGGGSGGSAYDTSRMSDTDRYSSCETGEDANSSSDCARVAVENSLYDFWSDTLEAQTGTAFTGEKAVETFSGAVDTGCGQASADVGPFYCPSDQTIYLDTTFFSDILEGRLGGPSGAFVEPYVLAHEYGHHIQNLLGTMGKVRTQQGPKSDSVRLELQADCYAGMWARSATTTEDSSGQVLISDLTDQDVQEAIAAATAVGDDRIQQQSGGSVDPDSWTHGSSAERVQWFKTGYQSGQVDACDTFAPGAL